METFSLLIKPASGDCNLRCAYCFYLCKRALFPETPRHRMTSATLERLVASFMQTYQPQYTFGWQGGEPTLMGLDFFREAVALQRRHGRSGARVANGLQTNATLLDDAWGAFFAEHHFLIGCSLDGPAELHDRYRTHTGGAGSHAEVMRGLAALQRQGAEFNILVLVSQANVRDARRVYRYLTDQGFYHQQYIPCVEFAADGRLQPYAIGADEWGAFLCELFDAWHPADVRRVSIRHHDALLAKLVDGVDVMCTTARDCRQYFVVEHNGNVYPCDFFVAPDHLLGNIATHSWEALRSAPAYQAFGRRKTAWDPACDHCPHLTWCHGDCPKHRHPLALPTASAPMARSHLCEGWKRYFEHVTPALRALGEGLRHERHTRALTLAAALPPRPAPPAGRNASCPCGSGRKWKHCCGR